MLHGLFLQFLLVCLLFFYFKNLSVTDRRMIPFVRIIQHFGMFLQLAL
ncbi:hypothetical protein HMPREF1870_00662 [Bacteroidales bacterium KA00344]|nr:hypothetical protein HMPREF1870_00662 [Bacteroidales bacterium KA00344]